MSLFSWQCQNPCRLSLAFIIDWRVVGSKKSWKHNKHLCVFTWPMRIVVKSVLTSQLHWVSYSKYVKVVPFFCSWQNITGSYRKSVKHSGQAVQAQFLLSHERHPLLKLYRPEFQTKKETLVCFLFYLKFTAKISPKYISFHRCPAHEKRRYSGLQSNAWRLHPKKRYRLSCEEQRVVHLLCQDQICGQEHDLRSNFSPWKSVQISFFSLFLVTLLKSQIMRNYLLKRYDFCPQYAHLTSHDHTILYRFLSIQHIQQQTL